MQTEVGNIWLVRDTIKTEMSVTPKINNILVHSMRTLKLSLFDEVILFG